MQNGKGHLHAQVAFQLALDLEVDLGIVADRWMYTADAPTEGKRRTDSWTDTRTDTDINRDKQRQTGTTREADTDRQRQR